MEEDVRIKGDVIHERTTELIRKKKEIESTLYPYERKRLDMENDLEVLKNKKQSLNKDDK